MKDVEHVLTGWQLIVGANAVHASVVRWVQTDHQLEKSINSCEWKLFIWTHTQNVGLEPYTLYRIISNFCGMKFRELLSGRVFRVFNFTKVRFKSILARIYFRERQLLCKICKKKLEIIRYAFSAASTVHVVMPMPPHS